MKLTITKTEKLTPVQEPPVGSYQGKWSGYVIEIPIGMELWRIHTAQSVRGIVRVKVMIEHGSTITVRFDYNR